MITSWSVNAHNLFLEGWLSFLFGEERPDEPVRDSGWDTAKNNPKSCGWDTAKSNPSVVIVQNTINKSCKREAITITRLCVEREWFSSGVETTHGTTAHFTNRRNQMTDFEAAVEIAKSIIRLAGDRISSVEIAQRSTCVVKYIKDCLEEEI